MFNDLYKNSLPEAADYVVVGVSFEEIMRAALDAGTIRHGLASDEEWLADRLREHLGPATSYIGETADGRSLRMTECPTADGGIVSIRSDVTQLKKTELALKARVAELEDAKSFQDLQSGELGELAVRFAEAKDVADAASRTKSEFLANMSHELRTPLNAVMGFSEVIKNEMFGAVGVPQYVDYAADIYASGAHLLEIINDILDLSKVEAGKLELAEERLDLRAVVESVFQLVKGRADEGGVKLMHDIANDLPRLYADKRKLKQMLLNLLSNAIKFTRQGGAVDLVASVADDGGLAIRVRDTGIGIAAEQFDLVLSPFGQVDSALAREHQGTGLGLPLVKALVELHDGHLVLESEPGVGTNISLCFPPDRTR
jgi:two-component system cell cycle sensor histidine kinase PleC